MLILIPKNIWCQYSTQRNSSFLPDIQTLYFEKCYIPNVPLLFIVVSLTVSFCRGVSLNCHNNSQLKSDLKDLFKTAQAAPEKIENTKCQSRLNEKTRGCLHCHDEKCLRRRGGRSFFKALVVLHEQNITL